MLFRGVFTLTVLLTLAAGALVGGRQLGLLDDAPAASASACQTLSSPQRKALLGTKAEHAQTLEASRDGEGCRWSAAADDARTYVEVSSMSAQQWVSDYAGSIAEQEATGDPARRAVNSLALELGTGANDQEACALASRVFALDGAAPGAQRRVTFDQGNRRRSPRVVAEGCDRGVFVSVVAATPSLRPSAVLSRRVAQALRNVQNVVG